VAEALLHFAVFSGKREVCLLVQSPERGQVFGNLKCRSPLHGSTQHRWPCAAPQLRDTGPEDVGHDGGRHARCTRSGAAVGDGEGPRQAVSKAALRHSGTCGAQVPGLLVVTLPVKEKMRLKEDDATCSVYPAADEL